MNTEVVDRLNTASSSGETGVERASRRRLGHRLGDELALPEARDDLAAAGVGHRAGRGRDGEATLAGLLGSMARQAAAGQRAGNPRVEVAVARRDVQAAEEGHEGLRGADGITGDGNAHGCGSYFRMTSLGGRESGLG